MGDVVAEDEEQSAGDTLGEDWLGVQPILVESKGGLHAKYIYKVALYGSTVQPIKIVIARSHIISDNCGKNAAVDGS